MAPAEARKAPRKPRTKKATGPDVPPSPGVFDDPGLPEFAKTKENAELLRAALPFILADDRGVWIKILAALKTLEPEWGPAARAIADWWAKTSSKYGPAEQEKAWGSLDADRPDGVTILTLFYTARENGWADPRLSQAPEEKPPVGAPISLADFVAYREQHNFIFKPTRAFWPAASVDAELPPVQVPGRKKAIPGNRVD